MDQRVSKSTRDAEPSVTRLLKWWTWKRALVATLVILVVLEIGTFAFNWTWTGFKANDTVWDWLHLLLIPIALAAVPIWFTAEEGQQRIWLAQLKWIFFGKRSDLSGIVHRNLHFQLVLDRIQRSR